MSGRDAVMHHLETVDAPAHTLKVVVLDTSLLGRPLTLADLHAAVGPRLGLLPWTSQRVVTAPGLGARPFLVDVEVALDDHLDECTLDAATPDLDAVCARLAEAHLPLDRPRWALTLVHGLPHDRQAVVARVHHAMADGLASLNAFLAVTSEAPDGAIPQHALTPAASLPSRRSLVAEVGRSWTRAPQALRAVREERIASRATAEPLDLSVLPPVVSKSRTSLNGSGDPRRTCASSQLSLAALKEISRETGATVNGVLHALAAGALREELASRGEPVDRPLVATFGVVEDLKDPRVSGNAISTASVYLHVQEPDPIARLDATARSCLVAVARCRQRGYLATEVLAKVGPRLASVARQVAADRTPVLANHITTASLPGPREHRWFGPVEVVNFFSQSLSMAPADLNLTAYSYGEHLSLGLVATPSTLPDPAAFLDRMGRALMELTAAVTTRDERARDEPARA